MEIGTYQTAPETYGRGTIFFADCGHRMFSVKDEMAYHGCYCPACWNKGVHRVLYIRGSKEANKNQDKQVNIL